MNQERIFNLLQMELITDQLRLESELERVINSDIETKMKLEKIKKILTKLVNVEASIVKFINLTSNTNNNQK